MAYQLGKKVQDEGIWREYQDSGASFLIGRAGSVEYMKVSDRLKRPHRKRLERGTLDSKTEIDINLRSLSEAVLLDWKGVNDENGDAVAYTPELGYQALSDDPDLLEFVVDISVDLDNFRVAEEKKIAKKSSKQSAG